MEDDDNKYDKILEQRSRSRKYCFLAFLVACGLFGLGVKKGKISLDSLGQVSGMGGEPPVRSRQSAKQKRRVMNAVNEIYDEELEEKVIELDAKVRAIKATGVIMETDEKSLQVTEQLQSATKELLKVRYGDHNAYRVKVDLEFQPSIPDFAEKGKDGTIVIEMAPINLIPVSVFTFLEIARTWKGGAFHRNAAHVLQATANSGVTKSLPFQEYSPEFPHKLGTTGYCGRPSGPCWYISIMDNTKNHGPGSQQKKNPHEADANFGKIVQGMDDVVPRIHTTPQTEWLDEKNHIFIRKMTILVPGDDGSFVEWKPGYTIVEA